MKLDAEHYKSIIRQKELPEIQLEADSCFENKILSKDISLDEIKRSVKMQRNGRQLT